MRKVLMVVLLPLLGLAISCTSTMNDNEAMTSSMGLVPAGDIAGIVATANEGEIMEGNAAASRASSADVRSFAQMMVSDHTKALADARALFARINVTPGENDITRQLQAGAQKTVTNLGTYSGDRFDRTYMQSQVDTHQWLLNQLDNSLIPSARGELKSGLQAQRAAVAMHLERAREILGRL